MQHVAIRIDHCKMVADHVRVSHLLPETSKKQQVIDEVATGDGNIHFHLKWVPPYGVCIHCVIIHQNIQAERTYNQCVYRRDNPGVPFTLLAITELLVAVRNF